MKKWVKQTFPLEKSYNRPAPSFIKRDVYKRSQKSEILRTFEVSITLTASLGLGIQLNEFPASQLFTKPFLL